MEIRPINSTFQAVHEITCEHWLAGVWSRLRAHSTRLHSLIGLAWRSPLLCWSRWSLSGLWGLTEATVALVTVKEEKRDKHARTCASYRLDFLPHSSLVFGYFGPAAVELLDCVCLHYHSHTRVYEWEAHSWVFCRLICSHARGGWFVVAWSYSADAFSCSDCSCCLLHTWN